MAANFVIKNVLLFDGVKLYENEQDVVVENGIIVEHGRSPLNNISTAIVQVDGKGCTLLPGLIDGHVHVFRDEQEIKRCIRTGVTTVLDMNNDPTDAIFMKSESRTREDWPEIYSALYAASIDGGWPIPIIRHLSGDKPEVMQKLEHYPKLTLENAEDFVASHKRQGADFIKLMQESGECITLSPLPAPSKELQQAIISAAHRHDLVTAAHAMNLRETILVLEAGVDGLAHQCFDKPHTSELIDLYKQNNAFLIPTFTAISSLMGLNTAENWTQQDRVNGVLDPPAQSCLCSCMQIATSGCNIQYAYDCVRALKQSGIDVICGTDSGPTIHGTALGAAIHLELELYVTKSGFTPVEALRSATETPARRFGLKDRGNIGVGKRADLLLVRGDPCKNIRDTVNVEKVWKGGQLSFSRS